MYLGDSKPFIDKQFNILYGEKFKENNDYKFLCLLIEEFPEFKLSAGLPLYFFNSASEIIYDIFANYNVVNAIKIKDDKFFKFVNFLEAVSKNKDFYHCVIYVYESIIGFGDIENIQSYFGSTTQEIWNKYKSNI